MPYNYKTELERYRRYYQSLEPILGKPRAQSYTAVVFSFLVVSLFGLYAIRPTIQTILTLKREIQDKTDISQKMEDKIGALIQAQAAYTQVESSLPVINEALPDSPEAIPLVIQLRNLARNNGLTLSSVQLPAMPLLGKEAAPSGAKPTAPASVPGQQSLKFTIAVVGPYAAIQAFLAGIQEMRRIVVVESMSVAPDTTADPSASASAVSVGNRLQLFLTLSSYYLTL